MSRRDEVEAKPIARRLIDEIDERDVVIDKLLAMLKPKPELLANAALDYQANFELGVVADLYYRALEIAGRASTQPEVK